MLTRAQAEALLTLAESLEACERQGLELLPDGNTSIFYGPQKWIDIEWLKGVDVRLAVNALILKQET